MPILPSAAADVGRLIGELSSAESLQRETAVARLAVIGARAVTRLIAVVTNAALPVHARVAALQALDAIGDGRALPAALAAAEDTGELGLVAIAVVGSVARTEDDRASRAFDWLAALALDRHAPESRRLAALTALDGLPAATLQPIYKALADDASPHVAARATRRGAGDTGPLDAAISRGLQDDPALVSAMIRDDAESTPVTALRQLLDEIRARERQSSGDSQIAWTTARGQVHQILAGRSSRIGLYDLRETLERADGPLPVGFLAAASAIGDAGCLEPLAAAWVKAAENRWWRDHLADAFRAIVRREAITRKHPVLKRILEKRPAAGVLVASAKK